MKNKSVMFCLVTLLFSLVLCLVSADIGPKPSADIHVTLNGQNISVASFNSKMLTCQKEEKVSSARNLIPQLNISEYDSVNNCYWKPAELAWGGDCQDSNCHFNYDIPSEFRLAVYLPSHDKVYLSAKATRENFRSTFEADLLSDGSISLQETTAFAQSKSAKSVNNFFIALILTLILELLVALIYASSIKISKKILISVLIANLISLPIVWFVFPLLKMITLAILLGETFAFGFEGYFIHLLNKNIISLKKSFVLSILMNLASLIIGGFIYLVILIVFSL